MAINDTKVTKNVFAGGINSDVDPLVSNPSQYRDSLNVQVTSDGGFYALKNLKGTSNEDNIIAQSASYPSDDTEFNVLGVWGVNAYNNGTTYYGVAILHAAKTAVSTHTMKLDVYVPYVSGGTFYTLYTDATVGSEHLTAVGDAVIYSESGSEILYFTDGVSGIYKIPLDVGETYTREEALLQRKHTEALLTDVAVASGGSLKGGSYQFAIRYANSTLKKYSEWSLLSNPVNVGLDVTSGEAPMATIGGNTKKKITLTYTYDTTQETNGGYDYYQIAAVGNIDGTSTVSLFAYMLGTFDMPGTGTITHDVKSIENLTSISISDIVVDSAAIKTVKTLAVKNNRLIGGNIEYFPLDYDNGNPSIDTVNSGLIYQDVINDSNPLAGVLSDTNASKYKGYFRNEVYRFAVSYHDEFGNWSEPYVLDTSGITGNGISGAVDFKFPDRQALIGKIFDGATNDNARAIAVHLAVENHPTWAKGMAILRAKRVKNIVAQTPLVPSILVQPPSAIGNYPSTYKDSTGTEQTDDTAQPSDSPLGTLVPKDYTQHFAKSIVRNSAGLSNYSAVRDEEVIYTHAYQNWGTWDGNKDHSIAQNVHFVYPPELLYGNSSGKWSEISDDDRYQIRSVDVAILNGDNRKLYDSTSGYLYSDCKDSKIHSTYYATESSHYYFSGTEVTDIPAITESTNILEMKYIGYGDETLVLTAPMSGDTAGVNATASVMNYSSVRDEYEEGVIPVPNECFVIVTEDAKPDVTHFCYNNAITDATTNDISIQGDQLSSTTEWNIHIDYTGLAAAQASYQTSNDSRVEIVNIEKGLSDDRYGSVDAQLEYVFTGAYVEISNPSTMAESDVWGGDCFIGIFTFKTIDGKFVITDSTRVKGYTDSTNQTTGTREVYQGLAQVDEEAELRAKWGRRYAETSNYRDCRRPYAIEESQYIGLFLESEINPSGIVHNTGYGDFDSTNKCLDPSSSESIAVKTPFSYKAHMGMSVGNDQKVFYPYDILDTNITDTSSRLVYSDQKIYNSNIEGFDVFKAGSYYDLDESHGIINKLVVSADKLFAFQNDGFAYIPVGANIIETTDANQMSVRSAEVIGNPQYISTSIGTEHPKTVQEDSGNIFFFDYSRGNVYKFSQGQGLQPISDRGLSSVLRGVIGTSSALYSGNGARHLSSFYDAKNGLYGFTRLYDTSGIEEFAYIWDDNINEGAGGWVSRWFEDSNASIFAGTCDKLGRLFLIGKQRGAANPLIIGQMYEGSLGNFAGVSHDSFVEFYVNPEPEISKTYDTMLINATDNLDTLYMEIDTPDYILKAGTAPSTFGIDLDITDKEGLFELKILRNQQETNKASAAMNTGQRMRGTNAKYKITFDQTKEAKLNQVITRYRPSYRSIQ